MRAENSSPHRLRSLSTGIGCTNTERPVSKIAGDATEVTSRLDMGEIKETPPKNNSNTGRVRIKLETESKRIWAISSVSFRRRRFGMRRIRSCRGRMSAG